jgi:AcrR family transcriptional regulator
MPRPAPDLAARREQVLTTARDLAEAEGWPAVTMRALAGALGVTQPVLYTVFDGRQALVDAVALEGYRELADALEAAEPTPLARMRAYLDFAAAHPRTYEVLFMPTELPFNAQDTPPEMKRAFAAVSPLFPDADGTHTEVVWALLHGLSTLTAGGRLPPSRAEARLELAHDLLTRSDHSPQQPAQPA